MQVKPLGSDIQRFWVHTTQLFAVHNLEAASAPLNQDIVQGDDNGQNYQTFSAAPSVGSGGRWSASVPSPSRARGRGGGKVQKGSRVSFEANVMPDQLSNPSQLQRPGPSNCMSPSFDNELPVHSFTHLCAGTDGTWQGCRVLDVNNGYARAQIRKFGADSIVVIPEVSLAKFQLALLGKSVFEQPTSKVQMPAKPKMNGLRQSRGTRVTSQLDLDASEVITLPAFLAENEQRGLEMVDSLRAFMARLRMHSAPVHLKAAISRVASAFLQSIRHGVSNPQARRNHRQGFPHPRVLWASRADGSFRPVRIGSFTDIGSGHLGVLIHETDYPEQSFEVPLWDLFHYSPDLNGQSLGFFTRGRSPPSSLLCDMEKFLQDHNVEEFVVASVVGSASGGSDPPDGGGGGNNDTRDSEDTDSQADSIASRENDSRTDNSVRSSQAPSRGRNGRDRDSGPQKFDYSLVKPYTGDNRIGPANDYWLRPLAWCKRVYSILLGAGIREENMVRHAIRCLSDYLHNKYRMEKLKPENAPTGWQEWSQDFPPREEGLKFEVFASWLVNENPFATNIQQQRSKFEALSQSSSMSVRDFNQIFNYNLALLHEIEVCQRVDAYANILNVELPEDPAVRFQYMCALLPDIGERLQHIVMQTTLQPLCNPNLASEDFSRARSEIRHGLIGLSLDRLQQLAIELERSKAIWEDHKQQHLLRIRREANRAENQYQSGSSRTLPASASRSVSRPRLLNSLTTESDVEAGEDATVVDTLDCESLYARLQAQGRIAWDRAQVQRIVKDNRCFNCGVVGHTKKECPNPAADPRTFHFHALEVVNRLPNDDELLHALLEYGDAPKNGIPFPC